MTTTREHSAAGAAKGQPQTDSEQLAAILLAQGLVDRHGLERAMTVHRTQGRWLGSVLIELGTIAPDEIVRVLCKHLDLRPIELDKMQYQAEAVRAVPESMARRFGVVPLSKAGDFLHVAMVNPLDTLACDLLQARTGMRLEKMVATERAVRTAIDRFYSRLARESKQTATDPGAPVKQAPGAAPDEEAPTDDSMHVDDLLRQMMERHASDLHLSAGSPPTVRVNGELLPLSNTKLTPSRMHDLVYAILRDDQITEFEETRELDFAYSVRGLSRFRVNVHRQRGSTGAVFRAVPVEPPSLDGLGMPEVLKRFCTRPRGLVLVTGPTGSGKSTTQAAMIREINMTRRRHIVTIEDPIEFLHANERSIIIQREVGSDTRSFQAALRHVLRQDPDVILIGEMRDLETISAALTAAETGHLVIATLHTTSASQTVDRIVDVFPPHQQEQVRVQLSTVLEGIVCQTLLPSADGRSRVCAQEILVATSAVRNLVREGKSHQIPSVLQSGASEGMQTLDQALMALVKAGRITPQNAMAVASNPHDFQIFLRMG